MTTILSKKAHTKHIQKNTDFVLLFCFDFHFMQLFRQTQVTFSFSWILFYVLFQMYHFNVVLLFSALYHFSPIYVCLRCWFPAYPISESEQPSCFLTFNIFVSDANTIMILILTFVFERAQAYNTIRFSCTYVSFLTFFIFQITLRFPALIMNTRPLKVYIKLVPNRGRQLITFWSNFSLSQPSSKT